MKWADVILTAATFSLLLTCSEKPCPPEPPLDPNAELRELLAQTPRDNREAEEMALWLSRNLVAPESLYLEILAGLTQLREAYADSISELSYITFRFPRPVSRLIVGLEDWVAEAYRNGEYTAWDSLNDLYRLDTIRIRDSSHPGLDHASPRFHGVLHPDTLAVIYQGLQGSRYVVASNYVGDWSCLYPWKQGSTLTFLLRYAWGDCPAGCLWNRYWYFRVEADGIDFVGTFDWQQPTPEWWEEASEAIHEYWG